MSLPIQSIIPPPLPLTHLPISRITDDDSLPRCVDFDIDTSNDPHGIFISQCRICDHIIIFKRRYNAGYDRTPEIHCSHCDHLETAHDWRATVLEEYNLKRICWACGHMCVNPAACQPRGDICGRLGGAANCTKQADGTDELVWVGRLGGRVDLEGQMEFWREVDEKARGKVGICGVCGRVCKTKGGLTAHRRKCKGEVKVEWVRKADKLRARECIEVEGKGVYM